MLLENGTFVFEHSHVTEMGQNTIDNAKTYTPDGGCC